MAEHRRPEAGRVRGRKQPRATARPSRHLFDHWRAWSRRLRQAPHVALFLDFDGTLAPLAHHPGQVRVPDATLGALRRLARHPAVTVSVVSGRRVADVRQYARIPGVGYMGLHGWERDGRRLRRGPAAAPVRRLKRWLRSRLARLEGIWVEDKILSLVVHYRRAPQQAVRRARSLLRQVLAPQGSRLRVMRGKTVWEILPREVKGKGEAVGAFLAELPEGTLPIYLGDDTSDESAFAALPEGLTVRVGIPRRTRARFALRSPSEVGMFLERLEEAIAGDAASRGVNAKIS